MAKRQQVRRAKSIFPQKLWRLINDQRLDAAIRWAEDGKSFLICEAELTNKCLGKENNLFYTKQPKSFVRQLHLYGFRKINKNQFSHCYFIRGQPNLLKFIKRSYKPNMDTSDVVKRPEQILEITNHQPKTTTTTTPFNNETNFITDNHKLQLSHQTIDGAIALSNNYDDDDCLQPPIDWYESNYNVDNSYNYNDDSILNLYNNDIYPNTCDDNNITL